MNKLLLAARADHQERAGKKDERSNARNRADFGNWTLFSHSETRESNQEQQSSGGLHESSPQLLLTARADDQERAGKQCQRSDA